MSWLDEIATRWKIKDMVLGGGTGSGYMSSYATTDNPGKTIPGVPDSRQIGQGMSKHGNFTEIYRLDNGMYVFYDPKNGGTISGFMDEGGNLRAAGTVDLGNSEISEPKH